MASIASGKNVGVATTSTVACLDIIKLILGQPGFAVQDLTSAVDFVLAQPRTGREVANFSLETSGNSSVDAQIQRLLDANIPVVVAAGNGATNVTNISPARVAGAITVGNIRVNGPSGDEWFSTSNFGAGVDVLAPGVSIPAALNNGGIGSAGDGTSASAAHVSGLVALYLQGNAGASPATVAAAVNSAATLATVAGLPAGTTNKVAFVDFLEPLYSTASIQRLGQYGKGASAYSGANGDAMYVVARRKIAADAEATFIIGGVANSTTVLCSGFSYPATGDMSPEEVLPVLLPSALQLHR